MFNKVPEQDPFAVSNDVEENIKLFPSFEVSVKFNLPYYYYYLYSLTLFIQFDVRRLLRPTNNRYRHFPCSMGSSETNNILLFNV